MTLDVDAIEERARTCSVEYEEPDATYSDAEEDMFALIDEVRNLRVTLAPILAHADNPDTAPPLRISVRQAREMKEKVENVLS